MKRSLLIVLFAGMALSVTGCLGEIEPGDTSGSQEQTSRGEDPILPEIPGEGGTDTEDPRSPEIPPEVPQNPEEPKVPQIPEEPSTPPAATTHVFEAEDFQIVENFVVFSDSLASKGRALRQPSSVANSTNPGVEAHKSFEVKAPQAFTLWLRMLAPSSSSDAIYVGFNSNLLRKFNTQYGKYEWIQVTTATLNAGTHSVSLGHGESLAQVDMLVATTENLTVQQLDTFADVKVSPPPKEDPPKEQPPKEEPPKEQPPAAGSGTLGPQKITGSGTNGDYYVSPSGSDSNSGTMAQPFKTITKAASKARPGDLIYVRGGKYPGFRISNLQGQSNAPITFRAFPGETPLFDANLGVGDKSGIIVFLQGDNRYLTFDGLSITDNGSALKAARKLDLNKDADIAEFKAKYLSKLESIFPRAIRLAPSDKKDGNGNYTDKAQHIVFKNMTIYNVGNMAFSIQDRVTDVTVENSRISDIGYPKAGYGVYTHGKNFTFRNNIVNNAVYGLHIYSKSTNVTGVRVENNYFYNIGIGYYWHKNSARAKSGGVGVLVDDPGEGARVINNIVRNCSIGISASLAKTVVAHNLVYGCGTGISVSDVDVDLYNNISHSNKSNFSFNTKPRTDRGSLSSTSVVLVDNAKPERGITSVPTVKDKGVYVEGVTRDIMGKARDSKPDIGPFEQ